jgi:hypothetical protein
LVSVLDEASGKGGIVEYSIRVSIQVGVLLRNSSWHTILIVTAEIVFPEQFVDAGTSRATEYVVAICDRCIRTHVTAMRAVQIVFDRMRVLLVHVAAG